MMDIEAERKMFADVYREKFPEYANETDSYVSKRNAPDHFAGWLLARAALATPHRSEEDINRTAQFYKDERDAANKRISELEAELIANLRGSGYYKTASQEQAASWWMRRRRSK